MAIVNFLCKELTGLNMPDDISNGILKDIIKDIKEKHNRHFRFVMEDIRKPYLCVCYECKFRTETIYCDTCGNEFCEGCVEMTEYESEYYCEVCCQYLPEESEEESD